MGYTLEQFETAMELRRQKRSNVHIGKKIGMTPSAVAVMLKDAVKSRTGGTAQKTIRRNSGVKIARVDSGASVFELEAEHCRWPIGQDSHKVWRFCGEARHGLSPYCDKHFSIAYTPLGRAKLNRHSSRADESATARS